MTYPLTAAQAELASPAARPVRSPRLARSRFLALGIGAVPAVLRASHPCQAHSLG